MYAKGVGIALLKGFFNAMGSSIGYAEGSTIGSTSMPRGLSLTSFLGYLIARLRAIVQLVTGLRAIMQWGSIQRLFLDCWTVCNHAVHLVSGVWLRWH